MYKRINLFPFLLILLLTSYACRKEESPEISNKIQIHDIIYYPEKNIFMEFSIIPEGSFKPLSVLWHQPSGLHGTGPFYLNISKNLFLDFDIQDARQNMERFTYGINPDTIDSVKYDYRNHYTGRYHCKVTHHYNGSYSYFVDTLNVEKKPGFKELKIIARDGNYNMIYLSPENFFGYHSGLYFTSDSIHFTASGPLGYYYTNVYEGIRITQ
jgi:hypothetical protein